MFCSVIDVMGVSSTLMFFLLHLFCFFLNCITFSCFFKSGAVPGLAVLKVHRDTPTTLAVDVFRDWPSVVLFLFFVVIFCKRP